MKCVKKTIYDIAQNAAMSVRDQYVRPSFIEYFLYSNPVKDMLYESIWRICWWDLIKQLDNVVDYDDEISEYDDLS